MFKFVLSRYQLANELVFSFDLLFEDLDHEIFRLQHILQVACQCIEAVVGARLCLLFQNCHAALCAGVGAVALVLLVRDDVYTFDLTAAVDAWDEHIRTHCFMLVNFHAYAFSLAFCVGCTFHGQVLAHLIVCLDLGISKDFLAPQLSILTHELDVLQVLLDVFLDADKPRFFAHERTLPCLFRELVEAELVESVGAFFALPGFDEDALAQRTQEFFFYGCLADYVLRIHGETNHIGVFGRRANGLLAKILRSLSHSLRLF